MSSAIYREGVVARNEIHLELLLGRRVIDPDGEVAGRIEEVRASQHGEELLVDEYLLGPHALMERLSASIASFPILGSLSRKRRPVKVPWERLDLSDPEHPRLLCTLDELKKGRR
jgi:hypothetical protein